MDVVGAVEEEGACTCIGDNDGDDDGDDDGDEDDDDDDDDGGGFVIGCEECVTVNAGGEEGEEEDGGSVVGL